MCLNSQLQVTPGSRAAMGQSLNAIARILTSNEFHSGSVKVRSGEGGKDRTVYLPDGVLPIIEDWLEIGVETKSFFCEETDDNPGFDNLTL
ncbi:MAG: hypothetical protein PT120_07445 [Aphanizomenon gracile PMC649.10]|nr:hypothetical protein [Aphanizomenon gracile PMC638.10]MDM3854734.1 hypothetical protein [Aphanizomenon gracile PMC649.10]MDM3859269.1 hypothetical protein [Aphanizomenon gracile PMC644.10]